MSDPTAPAVPSEVSFGCVLATDDEACRQKLGRLCELLGGALGAAVRPVVLDSPAELAWLFGMGDLDLVWSSPTLALLAPEMRSGVPVVRSIRQGTPHYHGVLFVRQDSSIESPLHLRGSRAAWVAQSSASGYLFPRVALAGHGLDPEGLFESEQFYEHHGDVALAVLRNNQADVGATYAAFERGDPTLPLARAGFLEVEGGSDARILLISPPIPSDLVMARAAVAEALGAGLVQSFEDLSLSQEALEALRHVLGADGLVRSDDRAMEELRRQVADAEALGVLDGG